jgi:hypothetical protein
MTIEGFCMFAHVNSKYLQQFESTLDSDSEEGQGFSNVISNIRDVIRSQKFAGAAADLLNANIIARDLGLKDESKHEHTGANGGPIQSITTTMTQDEAAKAYAEMVKSK